VGKIRKTDRLKGKYRDPEETRKGRGKEKGLHNHLRRKGGGGGRNRDEGNGTSLLANRGGKLRERTNVGSTGMNGRNALSLYRKEGYKKRKEHPTEKERISGRKPKDTKKKRKGVGPYHKSKTKVSVSDTKKGQETSEKKITLQQEINWKMKGRAAEKKRTGYLLRGPLHHNPRG